MDKSDLISFRKIVAEVRQLGSLIKSLESSVASPAGQRFTRTPGGPADGDRTMEAAIAKHQDLIVRYRKKVLYLNNRMAEIEDAVSDLDNPAERALLRYRYFQGYSWPKVATAMGYTERNVYRIHGMALLHLRAQNVFEDYREDSGPLDE